MSASSRSNREIVDQPFDPFADVVIAEHQCAGSKISALVPFRTEVQASKALDGDFGDQGPMATS